MNELLRHKSEQSGRHEAHKTTRSCTDTPAATTVYSQNGPPAWNWPESACGVPLIIAPPPIAYFYWGLIWIADEQTGAHQL